MSTNITAGRIMNDNKVKNLVITAFFTAITFLGIQSFRIPLPAAVGTPFLHFGHNGTVTSGWQERSYIRDTWTYNL